MKIPFLLFSMCVLLATNIFAQNNEFEAEISEVTVYSSSAEINYNHQVSLKKGKNRIVFTNLSPFIFDNSINISVEDENVNILTVNERVNYIKEDNESTLQGIHNTIAANNEKVALLHNRKEVLEREKSLLFKDKGIGGVANGVSVEEIKKASEFFNRRYSQINFELFDITGEIKELQKSTRNHKAQLEQETTTKNATISEIVVEVNSSIATSVKFNFSYLTYNAGWAPIYDVKYVDFDQDLEFVFRANVFNASNIDWSDIPLKLSTASPSLGFDLPTIDIQNNISTSNIQYNQENIKFDEVQTFNAIAEYKIEDNYSIPSNGKPYLIEVNAFNIPSKYSYVVIPKVDNNGFLLANIPNWNQYNIMSGKTNIYNQGTYLGKLFLNSITDEDELTIFLGKDINIEAFRKEIKGKDSQKITGNYIIDNSKIEYIIKNNHNREVEIKLIDQVPIYTEGDKIKMTLDEVDQANYKKNEGEISWIFNCGSLGVLNRKFEYTLKAPKEKLQVLQARKKSYRSYSAPRYF